MRFLYQVTCLTIVILWTLPAAAQTVLVQGLVHLRQGAEPEWDAYAAGEPDPALHVEFDAPAGGAALELTQEDVRRSWQIVLNGVDMGALEADERPLRVYRDIPPGTLKETGNVLEIHSASEEVDDVRVGRIVLHSESRDALLARAHVTVHVTEAASGDPLPSKITIVDLHGALQRLRPLPDAGRHLAVRPGSIYMDAGEAAFTLPDGAYRIYATRGFEYGVDSTDVRLRTGDSAEVRLEISREVDTEGWVAMDTHVHTYTYSGHGDAEAWERVLSLAGEGVEVPVITEHNRNVDFGPLVRSMGLSDYVAPIVGNEYTTPLGHFNAFPVGLDIPVPSPDVSSWEEVASRLEGAGSPAAVILNHARDEHSGFTPFGPRHVLAVAGRVREGAPIPANAMEVINSSAQQTDVMRLVEDWFGTLNAGLSLTPSGSSDSHDVTRYLVGQGRTYVRSDGSDLDQVVDRFRRGEVIASFGLMPVLIVDGSYGPGDLVSGDGPLAIRAEVRAPAWLEVDRVVLYMNGYPVREVDVESEREGGSLWSGSWTLDRPTHDVFLSLVAVGPGDTPPFWPIAKPYQRESSRWEPHVIGVTGAVWVDGDGDGRATPARGYAAEIADHASGDLEEAARLLRGYDRAVAAQTAAELYERGTVRADVRDDQLPEMSEEMAAGFRDVLRALRE